MSTEVTSGSQEQVHSLASSVRGLRRSKDVVFLIVLWIGLLLAITTLLTLLIDTFITGRSRLNIDFLTGFPSPFPEDTGIQSAIFGSIWVVLPAGVVSLFVAVCTAIYLEEYASKESRLQGFINLNIQTLAGVPSVVFGILGLAFVARGPLSWGFTVRTASMVLGMMILPIMIVSAREAIRAVPSNLRDGSYALGATRWQCVRRQVLPAAVPGIATGSILGVSRAIGESAPLIMLGALAYVSSNPKSFSDYYTVLPLAIFKYATEAQEEFQYAAAAAIIVLLVLMLALNFIAILIRDRSRKSW
jgi:phosphate transport system permease protein